jgi:hypothetical protein
LRRFLLYWKMLDNPSKVDFRCFLKPKVSYRYSSNGVICGVDVGTSGRFACHDELSLSIQSGETSYCEPRRNLQEHEDPTLYTHFEVALFYKGGFYNPAKQALPTQGEPVPEEVRSCWSTHDDVVGWMPQEKVQEIFDTLVLKEALEPQDFSWDKITSAKTEAEAMLGWSINR